MIVQNAKTRSDGFHNRQQRLAVVLFGLGFALLVLLLLTVMIDVRGQSDFPREAWAPYRLLFHGHVSGFLQTAPAYVGSLILRAPFALVGYAFGAGARATYVASALPCVAAPALLAGWLATGRPAAARGRHARRLWPLDFFMITPPAIFCITVGHPEDVLGAVLCVGAVLLAQRGSARAAGILLALALINKSWALIVAPLVFTLLPANKRMAGFAVAVLVTAVVMGPIEAIRLSGPGTLAYGLGTGIGGHALVPELLWFFGRDSWVVQQGHVIVILGGWVATGAWWLRVRGAPERPTAGDTMIVLALVLFLRAVLDPWDDLYYFTPFMLALVTYEDAAGGFPKLTWGFALMLVVVVPPAGLLAGLGDNGHAAVFALWALGVIAYLARRAIGVARPRTTRAYAAPSGSNV